MASRVLALSVATAVVAAAAACGSGTEPNSNIVRFSTPLTVAGEIGASPSGTTADTKGQFDATLDTVTGDFNYTVTYTGMSSNVTLGHIHGPFNQGQTSPPTAGIILNFDPSQQGSPLGTGATFVKGTLSGSASGSVKLVAATSISSTVNGDSLKKLLLAQKTYANIHTVTNGGGEVRGQILIVP